ATALGRIGQDAKEAIIPLADALSDRRAHVRVAAAEALGRVGADAKIAVPSLIEAWQGRKSYRRREGLGQTGVISSFFQRPQVPWANWFMEDEKDDVRKAALDALERLDPATAHRLRMR